MNKKCKLLSYTKTSDSLLLKITITPACQQIKGGFIEKTLTQQGAFRKERKALQRAIANGLTEKDIVMEMVKRMDNPDSAVTLNQASAAVMYLTALCNKETPITNAVNAILQPSPDVILQPV
ncbi:hypothetical protein [Escherichia coli]|uniref:hypothetical protein n=1 Tax=Escherichia coli TaxID=562 RepID=UPI001FCE4FB4|nr:hypothetical protein [Escherichia coli]